MSRNHFEQFMESTGGFRARKKRAHYVLYGLVPKLTGRGIFRGTGGAGGEFLKKRHPVATARDAHEALSELFRLRAEQSGAYASGKWHYIVVEQGAGRGKLAPLVSEDELRKRAAAGKTDPSRRPRAAARTRLADLAWFEALGTAAPRRPNGRAYDPRKTDPARGHRRGHRDPTRMPRPKGTHHGVHYYTWENARKVRDHLARVHPEARIVEYERGHAVQLYKSGPYYPESAAYDPRRRPARHDASHTRGIHAGSSYHRALTAARAVARHHGSRCYIKEHAGAWWLTSSPPSLPYVKVHPDERAVKHAAGDPCARGRGRRPPPLKRAPHPRGKRRAR